MTVFVYEYCCAVGPGPGGSLDREGRAMRDAVAEDFRRLPGATVLTLDGPDSRDAFAELAGRAEYAVVIAPEFDDLLAERCRWAREAGATVLGPTDAAIRLTADKLALGEHWTRHGVPTPRPFAGRFPAVRKPRFGAGSKDTHLLHAPAASADGFIVQDYVSGQPASVAFLIGPAGAVPLVPTFQRLTDDGRFGYLGGELPIPADFAERAVSLGKQAIACVPGLFGYVGVDLILGDADVAVEINPRLTTSYVGLRAMSEVNLAGAMLAVACGQDVALRWKPGRVRFDADGTIHN